MHFSSLRVNKLVTEFLAIEAENAKEADTLAFMARAMVMATLPHSKLAGFSFKHLFRVFIKTKNKGYDLCHPWNRYVN